MEAVCKGFIALLFFFSTPALAQQKLIFSGIQGSVNSEISMQVLKRAYQQIGIEVMYLPLPGERALRTANAGKVDGEVFRIANVHKKYTNLVPVPTPINVLQGIAFSKNVDLKIKDWQSLAPYNIGIQVGIKFAERGTKGMHRIMVDTNEQLFKMIDSGRVDVIVAAHANGLKTLSALKLENISALQPAIQEYPLYHYLHKKHAALVPKLDAVIKNMQLTGMIDQIRKEALQKLRGSGKTAD